MMKKIKRQDGMKGIELFVIEETVRKTRSDISDIIYHTMNSHRAKYSWSEIHNGTRHMCFMYGDTAVEIKVNVSHKEEW